MEKQREVYKHEGERLSRAHNGLFFECSAKENLNINELFKETVEFIVTKKNKQTDCGIEMGHNDVFMIEEPEPLKKYACCNIM
jgi:GTPase SAR1 family protein